MAPIGIGQLTIAFNSFSSFSSECGDLERLDISWNEISEITPGSFTGLDRVRHLLIFHNKLKHLKQGMFTGQLADFLKDLGIHQTYLSGVFVCLYAVI